MMLVALVAATQTKNSSPLNFLFLPLMFAALYFLILRPNQQRAKAQRDLTKSIDEGDEVMTSSGIYGFVTAIEGDVVWLEIADGVDVRVARAAITKKIPPSTTGDTTPPDADDDAAGDGPAASAGDAAPSGKAD